MRASGRGEAVCDLPWLAPGAASLVALASGAPADSWAAVRLDPGAVLLVLRSTAGVLAVPGLSFYPALIQEASVCEEALRLLDEPGFVAWQTAEAVYQASLIYAGAAARLAERTGACDADNAWVAGLLAPLGWLALAAVDADLVRSCRADACFLKQPSATQQRLWGFDQATIGRRLCRRWGLPPWLASVVGHLGLPIRVAQDLGADPGLFHVVQLAVLLAQQENTLLNLAVGTPLPEAVAELGLAGEVMEALEQDVHELAAAPVQAPAWQAPHTVPLLAELLRLAADNRRQRSVLLIGQLENEVDDLHRAVEAQHAAEAEAIRIRKLSALAEFAAGAGHEINNPLAVISGQAQYLLRAEQDASRQQALQTIIGQTHRVHELLRELMQFARPPRPQMERVDVVAIMREVLTSIGDLAAERRVRLVYPEDHFPLLLHADPTQLRTVLTCLVRNAIEAAGAEGWAGVRLERVASDQVDVIVEDSGTGPDWPQREHLFEPFYSGRSAGRGRGLGLPTAWRLAREQGGDVRFASLPGGPTRFILSMPYCNGVAKEAV